LTVVVSPASINEWQATVGVDLPRVVERVEHVVTGAVPDPFVRYVGA